MPHSPTLHYTLEAALIAEHYGRLIGIPAFSRAIERFDPNPDDFDGNGNLTFDGAHYLTMLIISSFNPVALTADLLASSMTRDQINAIRFQFPDCNPLIEETDGGPTDDKVAARPKTRVRRRRQVSDSAAPEP